MSLFNAAVDLNPHQIEAALFAVRSPLSKGVLLADEVGLGKTIEAGLVLCQCWAERRRRLLVICPASLRKQWALELHDKFNLPSLILEAKTYRELRKSGVANPFEYGGVVVTSMNFAARLQNDIQLVPWDLVVIDEAHKLRGAYQTSNRIGRAIRTAITDRRKILLTATPLQNSLLELYGLSTLIDEFLFGELAAFRTQYMGHDGDTQALKARLRTFCHRTLRRDVLEYVKYTTRRLLRQEFSPSDDEHKLYEGISTFLQRDDTYAIPSRQRELTTMVLRKLLASSSLAVASTLSKVHDRLIRLKAGAKAAEPESLIEQLIAEDDLEADLLEEVAGEDSAGTDAVTNPVVDSPVMLQPELQPKIDMAKLDAEIRQLDQYIDWARSIQVDTKSRSLLIALNLGFAKMAELGGKRKAVVFTESRKTQEYLRNFLDANGYAGKLVLFNGTNTGPETDRIFEAWVAKNGPLGRVSGSKIADRRQALIEHFENNAEILIATESAAEGINLQFCSMVVNYDLPWNPQRIEQRIGRCHRYGQKSDVVVVNFQNQRNQADVRVLQLLEQKFNLFDGVFGASDDVLGTIESGVDFEKRVHAIYQSCRTPTEIETAFAALQKEMESSIAVRMAETQKKLLENFDEDVHDRLKVRLTETKQRLGRFERIFWDLTKFVLQKLAEFNDARAEFTLDTSPRPDVETGRYRLISHNGEKLLDKDTLNSHFVYRLSHPLGEHVLDTGRTIATPPAHVQFHATGNPVRVAMVESLKGRSGHLILTRLTIHSLDQEEHLLFNAVTDDGNPLDQETCEKLFSIRGTTSDITLSSEVSKLLHDDAERHLAAVVTKSLESGNNGSFQGLDLFDRHTTLQFFWESLLDSYAIDFLATPLDPAKQEVTAEASAISAVLARAVKGQWEPFASPGAGQDWRWEDRKYSGSSLVWEDRVVIHLQLFPRQKQATPEQRRPRIRRRYGSPPSSPPPTA